MNGGIGPHTGEQVVVATTGPGDERSAERRRGGRFLCRVLSSNYGRVIDISTTGIRIRSHRTLGLTPGETVVIKLEGLGGTLHLTARAVRTVPLSRGGFDTGFEWAGLTHDERTLLTEVARVSAPVETTGDDAAERMFS